MTPKEQMIEFCKMPGKDQLKLKTEIIETLEKFLQTASFDDLDVLNQKTTKNKNGEREILSHGLNLSFEVLLLIGAYGKRFFGKI